MERKIVLRFRNGSRKDTTLEFPVEGQAGIRLGRESVCEVSFDAERDDVVSRVHSRIDVESADPPAFKLTDLNSRNGTFVNRQRISGSVALRPGDVIQLGPGGPEMEFATSGYPAVAKATRLATEAAPAAAATQLYTGPVAAAAPPLPSLPPLPPPPPAAAAPIPAGGPQAVAPAPVPIPPPPPGRNGPSHATVERMIQGSEQKLRSFQLLAAAAVVLVIVAAGLVVYRMKTSNSGSLTPADIAVANTDSVVFFEVGWKVVDTESGRELYQVTMPNRIREKEKSSSGEKTQVKEIIPGGPANLPVFVSVGGELEPMLSTGDGGGAYRPIGGQHTGSGFIVSPDGFILTNRHVAASWLTRYNFPDPAGVILQFNDKMEISGVRPIGANQFPAWVPANGRVVVQGSLDNGIKILQKPISGKRIEGRDDYMDVTLAKNRVRIPGKLARVSDQIDVAMVKIDLPRPLRKAELFDNYSTAKPGDRIVVLGYPQVSPVVVGEVQSKDVFNRGEEAKVIPDPTLSEGYIGRVIRGSAGLSEATYSSFGDVYQLTINSTGAGNSGGPVFDNLGRVIGIFTSSVTSDVKVTFAVPIRYGIELMGANKVM